MNGTSKRFYHGYSISTDSSDEIVLLPDTFRDRDSFTASSPATVSPDICFASNPSTSRSSSPLLGDEEDHKDLFFREALRPFDGITKLQHFPDPVHRPLRSSSLRGSYDNFFRQGYQQRRFVSPGALTHAPKESDSDYASSSHSGSDFSFDSDPESDSTSTDAELDDTLPSFFATAVKVKITPLRAVRRTVRRSYLLDKARFTPRKSSAEEGLGPSNPYWGIFVAMAARDDHASANEGDEETQTPAQTPGQWSTLTRKLSMDNLRRIITRKPSVVAIGPLDNAPYNSESLAVCTEEVDKDAGVDGDASIDIMEFHDVTQEAARLAAMMSFRWEFKPTRALEQPHCQ